MAKKKNGDARKGTKTPRTQKTARKGIKGRVKAFRRGKGRGASWFRGWKELLPSTSMSVPRAVFAAAMIISLVLLGIALLRTGGILDVLRLTERVATMRANMETLGGQNADLREEIRRLRKDPKEIERIARDELGLVRPGDTVYEFIDGDP